MTLYINELKAISYEIATECRICGELDYDDGKTQINFKELTIDTDSNGLHRYLITICKSSNESSELQNIDTLLSLLAVYFGCRFFKLSCYKHEFRIKTLFPFSYNKCPKEFLPTIFDNNTTIEFQRNRLFYEALKIFLDKFNKLKKELREQFIKATKLYLSALQHVGLNLNSYSYDGDGDHGRIMVYLMLISTIETLSSESSKDSRSSKKKSKKEINNLFNELHEKITQKELPPDKLSWSKWYEAKRTEISGTIGATKAFKSFIKKYSTGYEGIRKIPDENTIYTVYISTENFDNTLGEIYDARSRYLHNGTPMILSTVMYNSNYDWHFSGNILLKKLPEESRKKRNLLPYEWWFEGLVRHCLKNYLENKENPEGT